MYLILALIIGGVLLFGNLSSESAAATFQTEYQRGKNIYDNFVYRYGATYDETDAAYKKALSCDVDTMKISKELSEIIGMEPILPMLLAAILAKDGKIPYETINYYTSGTGSVRNILYNGHDVSWNYGGISYTQEERAEARLKFLKWYDQELKSHGIDESLVFVPETAVENGNLLYYLRNAIPVSQCSSLYSEYGYPHKSKHYGIVLWKSIAHIVPMVSSN